MAEAPVITSAVTNAPGWITIAWAHSGQDGVLDYRIDRQSPSFSWHINTHVGQHTDMGLRPSTVYSYRVCAVYSGEETACSDWVTVTTRAAEQPQPPPQSLPPTITSVETFPATLKRKNQIRIAWTSVRFEFFQARWDADDNGSALSQVFQRDHGFDRSKYEPLHGQVELGGGRGGSFTFDGAVPGLRYTFLVQGCNTDIFGTSECAGWSIPKEVMAQRNLASVRQFLVQSEQDPALGICRLLPTSVTSLRAFMQIA